MPEIAAGRLRPQSFGVTEPDAGTDTTRICTFAQRNGGSYVVNGGKIFTSRFAHSDLMLLLVRTTRYEDVTKKTDGMMVLLVDLREARDSGAIEVRPIRTMVNHETFQLSINDPRARPEPDRRGGQGVVLHPHGMNAERALVSRSTSGRASGSSTRRRRTRASGRSSVDRLA